MKEIELSKGYKTIVDDEDYEYLKDTKWCWGSKGYAIHNTMCKRKTTTISMHRTIMNAPKGLQVDHINGDTLDNRKVNLRVCTQFQNNMNKPQLPHKKYKGVYYVKASGNYQSRVKKDGKNVYFGTFKTAGEAAMVYNENVRKVSGEFAWLNRVPAW